MRGTHVVLVPLVIVALAGPGRAAAAGGRSEGVIVYQLAKHVVTRSGAPGSGCRSFGFLCLLDAGMVQPNGSDAQRLDLAEHPMTAIQTRALDRYFHVATPANSVKTIGPVGRSVLLEMTNWEAPSQTVWQTPYRGGQAKAILRERGGRFPGGLAVAPGNRYLVLPWVTRTRPRRGRVVFGRFDPFLPEGGLAILDTTTGKLRLVLDKEYNRALFGRFAGFSGDGRWFFTVARRGARFELVAVNLVTGSVESFAAHYPRFDQSVLHWNTLFPAHGDFSLALFAISPDGRSLVITKDHYDRPHHVHTCSCTVHHDMWVVPLDGRTARIQRGLVGYVSAIEWSRDSLRFAVVSVHHGGCYPQYINSSIDLFGRNGKKRTNLVIEHRSKITGARWSPGGRALAYDVYGTDFVGRIKTVDVASRKIREVVNTRGLGISVDRTHPITLLVAAWLR